MYRHPASLTKWLVLAGIVLAMCMTQRTDAQTAAQASDIGLQVKAAYLFKFTNFVEWPSDAFPDKDTPLVIGVINADAVADELERTIAGRFVGGRKLAVRKFRSGDPMTSIHMLFIGRADKSELREIHAAVKGHPVLTITDSEEAYASGSMINFVTTDDRLRFEVALKPVALSRLKISALMLSAAYRVTKGT